MILSLFYGPPSQSGPGIAETPQYNRLNPLSNDLGTGRALLLSTITFHASVLLPTGLWIVQAPFFTSLRRAKHLKIPRIPATTHRLDDR